MIVKSILDTDLYKLTMQQAVCKLYPTATVSYKVFNRGNHKLTEKQAYRIENNILLMSSLKLSRSEKNYLNSLRYMNPFYVDFLEGYRFDPYEVKFTYSLEGPWSLSVKGPWYRTILWETPILAMLSEVITDMTEDDFLKFDLIGRTSFKKAKLWHSDINFADFGTRRRANYESHKTILRMLNHKDSTLVGTSNVHLAMENGLKPIGTHAHEWYMFHAAKYGYRRANRRAIDAWSYVYDGDLGIALPDTFTTDLFLKQFSMKYAKLFDGVRQDSGNPIEFGEKIIEHYKSLGINPKHKTIVFSDSLDADKAIAINERFRREINCSFGIGTNITNDFDRRTPNIVMKMTSASDDEFETQPTIKLSDSQGKYSGPIEEIEACLRECRKDDRIDSQKR